MNRDAFVAHLGVEVRVLDLWVERRWLAPERAPAEPAFTDVDVARARLIQDLTGDFGVNDEGVDIILHLLDQLHGVRRAFDEMRRELDRPPS